MKGGPSGIINLDEYDSEEVAVHELAHSLEYFLPGVNAATQEFLRYRCKDEEPQQLNKVIPGSGYDDKEKGRKDNFEKAFGERSAWYVGKDYGGSSSEIISMGLEKLYNDPTGFAKKDPEYVAFLVGILDGSLRKRIPPEGETLPEDESIDLADEGIDLGDNDDSIDLGDFQ